MQIKPAPSGLILITNNLIKPASVTAARAFIDDPETIYMIPSEKRRANFHYAFEYYLKIAKFGREEAYTTSERCEGIALWAYSENKIPYWATFRVNPFPSLRCGWRFVTGQLETNRIATEIKKKYAPAKHMYLSLLAVDPAYQGKGFASALLKPMLKRIDESHLAVYLETQNMKNVEMYQHFGFNLVNHTELFDGCCHLYAMLRDAH